MAVRDLLQQLGYVFYSFDPRTGMPARVGHATSFGPSVAAGHRDRPWRGFS